MNKSQIFCPIVAMLVVGIVFGSIHMRSERRALVSAVTQQIDAHGPHIAEILAAMRGSNSIVVEDAAFQELQSMPSTSLISRSMVRIAAGPDKRWECVIDTSPLGIPPRTIRNSQ